MYLDGEYDCSDVAVAFKMTGRGYYRYLQELTLVACGPEARFCCSLWLLHLWLQDLRIIGL